MAIRSEPCLVLLRHRRDSSTFLVVLDYLFFSKETDTLDDAIAHKRYYYDEQTCPTNYLGVMGEKDGPNVMAVIDRGDDDPHGVFEFVRAVKITAEQISEIGDCNFHDYGRFFPEAFANPK